MLKKFSNRAEGVAADELICGALPLFMGINITNEDIQHISGDRRRALGVTSTTTLPVVRGRSFYPGQALGYAASFFYAMRARWAM
jgi:hypothetical protein